MLDVNKTNTLEQANAPPGTELVIPENLPPIKVMNPGLYKNLCEQVSSIYKHCNELSFGTRKRHFEATKRFCSFLADRYRLQKFKNVEDRHFRAYAEYLKERGSHRLPSNPTCQVYAFSTDFPAARTSCPKITVWIFPREPLV